MHKNKVQVNITVPEVFLTTVSIDGHLTHHIKCSEDITCECWYCLKYKVDSMLKSMQALQNTVNALNTEMALHIEEKVELVRQVQNLEESLDDATEVAKGFNVFIQLRKVQGV